MGVSAKHIFVLQLPAVEGSVVLRRQQALVRRWNVIGRSTDDLDSTFGVEDFPLDDTKGMDFRRTFDGLHGTEVTFFRRRFEVVNTIGNGNGAASIDTHREGVSAVPVSDF